MKKYIKRGIATVVIVAAVLFVSYFGYVIYLMNSVFH